MIRASSSFIEQRRKWICSCGFLGLMFAALVDGLSFGSVISPAENLAESVQHMIRAPFRNNEDTWADEAVHEAKMHNHSPAPEHPIVSVLSMVRRAGVHQAPYEAPGISPTLKNVIWLSIQYMVVYMAYQLVRTLKSLQPEIEGVPNKYARLESIVQRCVTTVQFCPMLGILFIGTRLRASSLSPAGTGSPPAYAQNAMYLCTLMVFFDTVLTAALPLMLGTVEDGTIGNLGGEDEYAQSAGATQLGAVTNQQRPQSTSFFPQANQQNTGTGAMGTALGNMTKMFQPEKDAQTKAFEQAQQQALLVQQKAQSTLPKLIAMVRTVVTFVIYLGFTTVIEALLTMQAPPGNSNCPNCPWTWTPPVPPALQCLINLCTQYFSMFMALYVAGLYNVMQNKGEPTVLYKILDECKMTVKFCPMLAILFIGARLRAAQLKTEPQDWAKSAFYVSSYAVLGQTTLGLIQPLYAGLTNRKTAPGQWLSPNTVSAGGGGVHLTCEVLKFVCLLGVYVGTFISVYSVYTLETPRHLGRTTKPMSTAMRTIIGMLTQYFMLFAALAILKSYTAAAKRAKKLVATNPRSQDGDDASTNLELMLKAGIPSMELIPMLSVLSIAARFRAMEVRPEQGEVQPWAQLFMYLVSWAVMFLTIFCIIIPYFSGEVKLFKGKVFSTDPRLDAILLARAQASYREVAKYLSMGKVISLISVYVGAVGTIASILTIEPLVLVLT